MKQLTTEQQEQAIEIFNQLSNEIKGSGNPRSYYVEYAKAFLKSLKPKVYVCAIEDNDMIFLVDEKDMVWSVYLEKAKYFYSLDEARKVLDSLKKYEDNKYFILTE